VTNDQPSAGDFKDVVKGWAKPVLASLDAKLQEEVDRRVDEAVVARLNVLERAVADLTREVGELRAQLERRD